MIHNLELLRASHAQANAAQISKKASSKLPALIVNNGFLLALAYALERSDQNQPKRPEMDAIARFIHLYLKKPQLGLSTAIQQSRDAIGMATAVANGSAQDLRRCTDETLALLCYFKKYGTKE